MTLDRVPRRIYSAIAFRIKAKRRIARTDQFKLYGFSLEVPPAVFHPDLYFSSKVMASYLETLDLRSRSVLDMGCGAGILALVCAKRGADVTAIDINAEAVECTRGNALQNGLEEQISVLEGDLFGPLMIDRPGFDYIVFNPPFYPKPPRSLPEHAWYSGVDYQTIRRFAQNCEPFLTEEGSVLLVLSSDMDLNQILSFFPNESYRVTTVTKKIFLFETIFVYRAQRSLRSKAISSSAVGR